jgi:hypothetical protein
VTASRDAIRWCQLVAAAMDDKDTEVIGCSSFACRLPGDQEDNEAEVS